VASKSASGMIFRRGKRTREIATRKLELPCFPTVSPEKSFGGGGVRDKVRSVKKPQVMLRKVEDRKPAQGH